MRRIAKIANRMEYWNYRTIQKGQMTMSGKSKKDENNHRREVRIEMREDFVFCD